MNCGAVANVISSLLFPCIFSWFFNVPLFDSTFFETCLGLVCLLRTLLFLSFFFTLFYCACYLHTPLLRLLAALFAFYGYVRATSFLVFRSSSLRFGAILP